MLNPEVSIITPVYNAGKTLRPCINSILNQSYKKFEFILVDNNSTDKTKQIILEFQKKDSRIKYLFEKEQKRGAARNTGEKQARGKIILMTDSDCIMPPNWITEMILPIIKNECDAVQGSEKPLINDFWSQQIMLREKIKSRKNPLGTIDTKNFAISREALKKIGYSNRKYFSGNDTELAIRFQKAGLKLKFLKESKVIHKNESTMKGIMEKYFRRAKWCNIISRDNEDYLKKTDFLKKTNQTRSNLLGILLGIIKSSKKGFGYAYFDIVTGIAWRFGILFSIMENLFKKEY